MPINPLDLMLYKSYSASLALKQYAPLQLFSASGGPMAKFLINKKIADAVSDLEGQVEILEKELKNTKPSNDDNIKLIAANEENSKLAQDVKSLKAAIVQAEEQRPKVVYEGTLRLDATMLKKLTEVQVKAIGEQIGLNIDTDKLTKTQSVNMLADALAKKSIEDPIQKK